MEIEEILYVGQKCFVFIGGRKRGVRIDFAVGVSITRT